MESGTDKGPMLKVVWLCHVNNQYISDRLGIKMSLEFAPWISRFIDIFKEMGEIEVHVVSPHKGIIQSHYFKDENIHYHFFAYTIPWLPKRIFNFIHLKTHYRWNKWQINRIISRIKPDLIHMFGTENAYFTSSIFQFKGRLPVFISIQGFINQFTISTPDIEFRKANEIRIIKEFKYFGVRDNAMKEFLMSYNPEVVFYHHEFAPYLPKVVALPEEQKIFDVVFFARVCKQKGIEDLLMAISLLRSKQEVVKLAVIGPASESYYDYLKSLSEELSISEQVDFLGSIDVLDEVHDIVSKAKLSVLPTHADTIPGTLIESMTIGIPCISYPVGSIPILNAELDAIKLVKTGDIEELALAISLLLRNEEKRTILAANALKVVSKKWNISLLYSDITISYQKIINND